MGISYPWSDYIDIIALKPVTKALEVNPMGIITPWEYSIVFIAL